MDFHKKVRYAIKTFSIEFYWDTTMVGKYETIFFKTWRIFLYLELSVKVRNTMQTLLSWACTLPEERGPKGNIICGREKTKYRDT